jgi:hypothetical protein
MSHATTGNVQGFLQVMKTQKGGHAKRKESRNYESRRRLASLRQQVMPLKTSNTHSHAVLHSEPECSNR